MKKNLRKKIRVTEAFLGLGFRDRTSMTEAINHFAVRSAEGERIPHL